LDVSIWPESIIVTTTDKAHQFTEISSNKMLMFLGNRLNANEDELFHSVFTQLR